jgi:hypothetical protein
MHRSQRRRHRSGGRPTANKVTLDAPSFELAAQPAAQNPVATAERQADALLVRTQRTHHALPRCRISDTSNNVAQIFALWWWSATATPIAHTCAPLMSLECVAIPFAKNIS